MSEMHRYTSSEGSNVALGQHGSIFINATGLAAASTCHDRNGAFIAIQMLEPVTFSTLTADVSANAQRMITSNGTSTEIGSDGSNITGITFPQGMVIFGRWAAIFITKGKVIAYVGA